MTTTVLTATSGTRDFTKYDAYLDTQGLVFATGEGMQGQTQTKEQRPVRQDTGTNPWETRPESGDIFSQGDFINGMGQTYFHRQNRDEAKYLWSRGIDITNGTLKLHRAWAESDSAREYQYFTVAEGTLFGTNQGSAVYSTSDLTTWSTDTPTAMTAWGGLTNNGHQVFVGGRDAGLNGFIYRKSGGTWTAYYGSVASTYPQVLHWTKDRLIWWDATGNRLYEQTASGTANATLRATYQTGTTCKGIFTAGAYIYVIMTTTDRTIIFHYGLSTDATPILQAKGYTEFPSGVEIHSGVGYVGQVYLGGSIREFANTKRCVFYSATPDDSGHLHYLKVAEGFNGNTASSPELQVTAMTASEDKVYMSWPTHANADALNGTNTAVGCYDIARGSFSLLPSVVASAATSADAIAVFKGRVVFGHDATNKAYATSSTVYTTSGTFITSIADWNNAGQKVWDRVEWATKPLPDGATVQGYYTTKHPDQNDWTLFATQNTLNSESLNTTLSSVQGRIFALKFVLNRSTATTTTPELLNYSARSYPKPSTTEWRLTRYVRIMDLDARDGGGEEIRQNPETVREWLLNKANEPVTWYEAGSTWSVLVKEIGDIEPGLSVYSQTSGDTIRDVFVMRLVMEGTRTA